ncbi:hypothetical protein Tsp_03834 [Trichinella spiralis]|uniref:hypothetical protein n=1 Tax=Trichinella spiralis TaxID=6334 RepID=UPI0001EFC2D0|nr:hypothetical protein Tsp_03834 [Trichinella spiralis]
MCNFCVGGLRNLSDCCSDDGKKKHGRKFIRPVFCLQRYRCFANMGRSPFWVTGIDSRMTVIKAMLCFFSLLLQASNGQCKFQQQSDIYSKHCPQILLKEEMPSNSVLPLFLVLLVTFHWTLCQCFVLPTFREFQDFFKRASKSVPASDELTNGWKSLLSSMLPKILPEKTAEATRFHFISVNCDSQLLLKLVRSDMVRTVVDMVKLVNTSQPTSNEEHFNEAAAVTKSVTVDETIIRVPARSPSVMEQSLGLLRPFFGNIDPWRAILYRDPPLLSVDLADGDSQENDMTRSTLSLDSFKSNFFKSTNHDSQLLDELETEPVAAKRPFGHDELAIGSIFHICDSTKLNAISAAEKHSRWNSTISMNRPRKGFSCNTPDN